MLYFKPDGMLSAWRFLSRVLSDMTKIFTQFNNLMLFSWSPVLRRKESVWCHWAVWRTFTVISAEIALFLPQQLLLQPSALHLLLRKSKQRFAANILTLRWWTLSLKIVSSAFPCSFFFKHCAIFCSSCTVTVRILVL